MSSVSIDINLKSFSTAESRWARFGPYYAMFPIDFAFDIISRFSKKGDYILDPFAGRCSSIYAGGVLGRHSLGIEINPVGWLYGSVKLNPANKNDVLNRLYEINKNKWKYINEAKSLPEFFSFCYCEDVLLFLLSARNELVWENDQVDSTLMSIILVYLHGKVGEGLSNQMRMTKAMGPNYSINWWKKNNLEVPPEINPVEMIKRKIEWRYKKGVPKVYDSRVLLGDSTLKLKNISMQSEIQDKKFSLLFTSPPYCNVTDYHADQWLRLWLLGGNNYPKIQKGSNKGRFTSKGNYYKLLNDVFSYSSKMMKKDSVIYVRTDRRKFTFDTTLKVLEANFPNHRVDILDQPFKNKTQTELHGNTSKEKGEIDIILT